MRLRIRYFAQGAIGGAIVSGRMLRFVEVERETPVKRGATERAGDFLEIYRDFVAEKAAEQAARCSQCGVPYCQSGCPLHNNIPDWLKLTAEGRLEEAYELAQATNTFPEICGRICPQDRLCEGNCVIEQSGHGTVTIGAVERYVTENAWDKGWVKPIAPAAERTESVGIIGAGPAGLAAAETLREQGFKVVVYDRYDRAGGLLVYGIPGFKLEKDVVQRRVDRLTEAGVEWRFNTDVGVDVSFADLRAEHAAILIATGVYKTRDVGGPGAGLSGVVQALDYLTVSNKVGLGDQVAEYEDGALNAEGKNVVVIGGGDTAMDCVRTAIRQGAKSVACLYRRDRANMPGSQREVANAEEEGVRFEWLSAPKAFHGEERVTAVRAVRMRLGAPGPDGRSRPEEIPGSEFDAPADLAIQALGFEPEDLPSLWDAEELAATRWGTMKADFRSKETSVPGVFAAGDIVRGASLVVWAIRDGREAAAAMAKYIDEKAALAAE